MSTQIHLFRSIKLLCLIIAWWLTISPAQAQSFAETDANYNIILADTSFAVAMMVTVPPGGKTNVHTHAAHFVYAMTPVHIRVTYTDGEVQELKGPAGFSGIFPPERPHYMENLAASDVRFLVVEMKEHPYGGRKKNKTKI